jgi:hypothetical protein
MASIVRQAAILPMRPVPAGALPDLLVPPALAEFLFVTQDSANFLPHSCSQRALYLLLPFTPVRLFSEFIDREGNVRNESPAWETARLAKTAAIECRKDDLDDHVPSAAHPGEDLAIDSCGGWDASRVACQ